MLRRQDAATGRANCQMCIRDRYLRDYGFDLFPDDSVRPLYLPAVKYTPRPADGEIQDGQTISTGRVSFQVVSLPGHSAGHCGFLFPEQGFIFTADINLDSKPFFAMLDSDVDDFIHSIDVYKRQGKSSTKSTSRSIKPRYAGSS